MNKLITFGDSFIAQNKYFKEIEPISWLDIICKENNFDLDGYGCSETGILNTIMNFKRYDRDFEVCIFAWTDPNRDYLPTRTLKVIRSGYYHSITDKEKKIGEKYYKYFSDDSIRWLLSESVLGNFDKELRELYPDKKFIHLYCFRQEFNLIKPSKSGNINLNDILVKYPQKRDLKFNFYPHTFKHGINIRPSLMEFSDLFPHRNVVDGGGELHMEHPVHKSLANQLNTVLKDDDLRNGNIVEFNLEY